MGMGRGVSDPDPHISPGERTLALFYPPLIGPVVLMSFYYCSTLLITVYLRVGGWGGRIGRGAVTQAVLSPNLQCPVVRSLGM